VLISHGHHDHLDLPSLRRLDRSAPVLGAAGLGWALRLGGHAVRTMAPGDEVELAGVRVRAVPAAHDGRRVPVGAATSASASSPRASTSRATRSRSRRWPSWPARSTWRCSRSRAGDPRSGPGHMDPREAAEALAMLRPAMAVPIHWGTYRRIGHRGTGDPAREFVAHAAELAPDVRIAVLQPGGSVEITRPV
jgi:L-ascorbate metabolism protein UlaG (beta-lactamase superfamily)